MEQRSGFVSFGSTQAHLEELIRVSADQSTATWTAAEGANDGDLVVFYFTIPVGAFLAYGRILRRSQETWGADKKPMAEVGMIRLLPEPVTLKRAKERLQLPWLKAPQGFAKRRQENVALLLALGGAPWA
jgi:hypothetical protein